MIIPLNQITKGLKITQITPCDCPTTGYDVSPGYSVVCHVLLHPVVMPTACSCADPLISRASYYRQSLSTNQSNCFLITCCWELWLTVMTNIRSCHTMGIAFMKKMIFRCFCPQREVLCTSSTTGRIPDTISTPWQKSQYLIHVHIIYWSIDIMIWWYASILLLIYSCFLLHVMINSSTLILPIHTMWGSIQIKIIYNIISCKPSLHLT
jgi:hypothetical protein